MDCKDIIREECKGFPKDIPLLYIMSSCKTITVCGAH